MKSISTTPPTEAVGNDTGHILSKLLPELSLVATLLWVLFWPGDFLKPSYEYLLISAFLDAGTIMLCAMLVDVASRLKRPLSGWWLLSMSVGILLINPYIFGVLMIAWSLDLWTFLPFAWSLLERLRELYTLPKAATIEKLRRRTLSFDRLYTALVLGFMCVAGGIINALQNDGSMAPNFGERALPWVMLAFYSVAAFNAWRVHRVAFAQRPRSLWPWIDGDQVSYLNPL